MREKQVGKNSETFLGVGVGVMSVRSQCLV